VSHGEHEGNYGRSPNTGTHHPYATPLRYWDKTYAPGVRRRGRPRRRRRWFAKYDKTPPREFRWMWTRCSRLSITCS